MIEEWIKYRKFKKSKNYIHFDINKKFKNSQIEKDFFENFFNLENIKKYKFKPFIRYEIKEKKIIFFDKELPDDNFYYWKENNKKSLFWFKEKIRPITYASHRDSDLYSYYSFKLWIEYEKFLLKNNLEKNILAYRTVRKDNSDSWKNNINFSLDVFKDIIEIKNSIVFAFDISGFFDTLDHKILKKELIKTLWKNNFTEDWYKIFKSLTKFAYVDKEDIEENNLESKNFPKIIDSNKFNECKLKFKKEWLKLIKTNPEFPKDNKKNPEHKNIWIPQWTPISWVLANLYMNEFDLIIKDYVNKIWWKYYRYCDDILLIIPTKKDKKFLDNIESVSEFVLNTIKQKLSLKINNSKTEICIFENWKLFKNVELWKEDKFIYKRNKYILPFQYLWFTFDWNKVLLRNRTLSNYYKKMIMTLKKVYHLKDNKKDEKGNRLKENYIKWDKILLWKYNRKYLYNWKERWKQYKKQNWKYKIDKESKPFYLGFIWYWYIAYKEFESFCNDYNIKNGIKKQLSGHRKKYYKYIDKLWLK